MSKIGNIIGFQKPSFLLKAALFVSGFSGIAAEYVLATLASYYLGDTGFQWTISISIMLFSMGLGSRFSRWIQDDLAGAFVKIECVLSLFIAFSVPLTYLLSTNKAFLGFAIYGLCVVIGLCIGMEIPLAIRINQSYANLKDNVSDMFSQDYYGALFGGLFFAFVALPFLGLGDTAILLGILNISLAVFFAYYYGRHTKAFGAKIGPILVLVTLGFLFLQKDLLWKWGDQLRYKDPIVFSKQTRYQKIVLTERDNIHWLFINGNQQLCTLDERMYHEPLIHPIMHFFNEPELSVLILGGGDGCAARELLQYKNVKEIHLVDLDPEMLRLGKEHPVFLSFNEGAMNDDRVSLLADDGFRYLENTNQFYDLIVIDLPDPKSIDLSRLYSKEFYKLCERQLRENGMLITQAGSPYYAPEAFWCIEKTIATAGFHTLPLHNQVLSMGEWGWVLASKNHSGEKMKAELRQNFKPLDSAAWLNTDAVFMMSSFGKTMDAHKNPEINTLLNPVLHQYYRNGYWDLY